MSYATFPVRPVGGRLVLDFINTADWSAADEVIHEKLETQDDVRRWTDALEITRAVADGRPHDLPALRSVRADLRSLLRTALGRRNPDPETLAELNDLLALACDASRIARLTGSPWLVLHSSLLDVILTSAKAVLSDPREIGRVRLCRGPDCGWLFLDESRNQGRKWCTMETCGNRAKARRFYASKAGRPAP